MGRKVMVASVSLNQWAMDFLGNMKKIIESIRQAKAFGARFRCGQELEICGYSCSDHFLENDTFQHSWEVLAKIMIDPDCSNMLCTVGMPVMHKNVAYNCQVFFLNKKILLIRPKIHLCDDGNYRESRWFTRWTKLKQTENCVLPSMIYEITNQRTAPIGDALIETLDTCVAAEICEEMWVPNSRHIELSMDGAEIIANGSSSYHQLRKLHIRVDLIQSASKKAGGVFVFSNGIGCDGERVFWDGGALIYINGKCVAQGPQFSLQEVNVTTAVVDLDDVQMYRNSIRSRSTQAALTSQFPRIFADFTLELQGEYALFSESREIQFETMSAVEEIRLGPANWLWDYLRRSGQGGFFLPLSGGIDSSSTACVVSSMCHLVCEAVDNNNESVLADVRKITCTDSYVPKDPQELASQLFTTCYMGSQNSSDDTKNRAKNLASQIGSYHFGVLIDTAVDAILGIFKATFSVIPKFKAHNGTPRENLALQNVQARVRMVLSYLFAQLSLWARGRPGGLLVLGSANVDESLRGYLTKYDCSSADINPIGGISKTDLRAFILHCSELYNYSALDGIYHAPPTAELEPLENGAIAQTDEEDMGMTYEELSTFGKLRKQYFCGPFSMFCKLMDVSSDQHPPDKIAEKVRHFFYSYAVNRHKMTVLTPSYHCESYSPDDNRFDQRQFLYNTRWHWQTARIKAEVSRVSKLLERMGDNSTIPKQETLPVSSQSQYANSKPGMSLGHHLGATGTGAGYSHGNSSRNAQYTVTAQSPSHYQKIEVSSSGVPQLQSSSVSVLPHKPLQLPHHPTTMGASGGQYVVVARDPHNKRNSSDMEVEGDHKRPRDQVKVEATI